MTDTNGKNLRMLTTIAGLLLIFGGVVASLIETRVRVTMIEQCVSEIKADDKLHVTDYSKGIQKIEESLHKIEIEQVKLIQKVDILVKNGKS